MYQVENSSYIQQGWQCPKCLRINAPWVSQCPCYVEPKGYTFCPSTWSVATWGSEPAGGGGCQCT